MRILIIEDDEMVRTSLKQALEAQCYAVDAAEDGEKGSYLARTEDYDLVILDYMMPKKNGKQVCDEIRKSGKTMPILLLSVQSEVKDKVEALDLGADDYMTKPFSFDELVARIRALLRRPHEMIGEILTYEDLVIDLKRKKVTRGKQEVYLTKKEFMLLEYLLRNKESVVTRTMLIDHVWDSTIDAFSNTIESHILSLRKKVDKKRKKLIQTVPGRGYKIDSRR